MQRVCNGFSAAGAGGDGFDGDRDAGFDDQRRKIEQILSEVQYKDWTWEIRGCDQIRVSFLGADADTGELKVLNGRWWVISRHAIASEIVQTLFLAIKTAEEHEMREAFTYRGVRVFDPHFDLDSLAEYPPQLAYRPNPDA